MPQEQWELQIQVTQLVAADPVAVVMPAARLEVRRLQQQPLKLLQMVELEAPVAPVDLETLERVVQAWPVVLSQPPAPSDVGKQIYFMEQHS
jgi:hypothetical protein